MEGSLGFPAQELDDHTRELSDAWLADVRTHPAFDPNRDDPMLERIIKMDRGLSMIAMRQTIRQRRGLEGDPEALLQQLDALRSNFGSSGEWRL